MFHILFKSDENSAQESIFFMNLFNMSLSLKTKRFRQKRAPRRTCQTQVPSISKIHVAEFSSPTVIGCAQNFIWSVNGNAYLILKIFFAIYPIIPVRTVL